jgi:hypothetical protein
MVEPASADEERRRHAGPMVFAFLFLIVVALGALIYWRATSR